MHELDWQPAKAIFVTFQVLSLLIRIPLWIVFAVPKWSRPRRSWSIKRTLGLHLLNWNIDMIRRTGPLRLIPDHYSITPGLDTQGIWIPAVAEDLLSEEIQSLAQKNNVKPSRIPGYWLHPKESSIPFGAPPIPGEKVLLMFHGGAYIRLSGHPDDLTGAIGRGFLEKVPAIQRVFSVEYRLSKHGHNGFPAALFDAISGYLFLVNQAGYSPSQIILGGDSAGGNLALALTRYLVNNKGMAGLPDVPSTLVLLSPWADAGVSHVGRGSMVSNAGSDYVGCTETAVYAVTVFCGKLGTDIANTNPYLSPASVDPRMKMDFKGFPPTFIVCGGAEILADSIRSLRDKMSKDLGDKLGYEEPPDAWHDYMCMPAFEPERSETYKRIASWLAEI
ncbi:alpha/beta-hydrolase [Cylindrobasidium torrendii FP15055 ss-10]|uniref:Alpha/beta-hydrolase n=1 Tax=Cylindrobasidium torrendii FP15055 ss-10 TaxID=1314674 RepID=A0A0D7BS97_9AGAR|nr:alpha/beta-hydrolase [Cylindrobasidium torrendii FP15055 ss-10]